MVSFPKWIIEEVRENGYKKKIAQGKYLTDSVTSLNGQFVTELHPHRLTVMFSRTVEAYGFDHFTFHRLRAFSVSELSAMGVPDPYIMARGGWVTDHVMKKHYRRALQTKTDEVNQKINEHYADKKR